MFGIGFLNNVFLFALGAALLPVIIHLLNRRRIRKISFSSLRFMEEISRRRMRRVNMRRAIILLLRTLAVLFLVLAFARPALRGLAAFFVPGTAPVYTVVCLDASYSMGVEREQGTAFSAAKALATELVDQCGREDRLNLVVFATKSEALFDQGTRNKDLVKRTVEDIPLSQSATDIGGAIRYAAELIQSSEFKMGEIYVISDFRASADTLVVPDNLENIRLYFLPVYREAVDNAGIDNVFIPRKLIRPGEIIKIGVAVSNHSRQQEARFSLEIVVDGKRTAEKEVVLSPASSSTITFPLSPASRGIHRCLARKDRDRLALDDERFFLLEISKEVPVTIIEGRSPGAAGEPESGFYLSKALNPRTNAEGEFLVARVSERTVTDSDLPLKGTVAWTGPEGSDETRLDLVIRHVRSGGALAVFLENTQTGALGSRKFLRFIGVTSATPVSVRSGTHLELFRKDHPVFGLFSEEELELLSKTAILQYIRVRGVDPDSVLAYTGLGDPFMWECTRGKGKVLVFASAPDLEHGNLPLSPMFLPMVHTSMSYLADAVLADLEREGSVGDALSFDIPDGMQAAGDFQVHKDGIFYGTPRLIESSGGGTRALLDNPDASGFYALVSDTSVVSEAAVNPDPAEGNLVPAAVEEAARGGASIVETGERFLHNLQVARQGKEIFALFLFLAIAALALESLLGRNA